MDTLTSKYTDITLFRQRSFLDGVTRGMSLDPTLVILVNIFALVFLARMTSFLQHLHLQYWKSGRTLASLSP